MVKDPPKMKKYQLMLLLTFISFSTIATVAQTQIKRTTYKTDRFNFGVGGTVSVNGAPNGSIRIEGWNNREVEISAEIELSANTEAEIDRLTKVTTFTLQESLGRAGIISVGPNDRKLVQKLDKKFPKHLFAMPFRIDYVIKVPRFTDLEINGGKGDLSISGIDGTIRLNFLETNADIELIGGGLHATFGSGQVDITIPTQSWRGRFANVNMASGELNLHLPSGLNSEFEASILRNGSIQNNFSGFTPRHRHAEFTEKNVTAYSGIGRIPLKFILGEGSLKINEIDRPTVSGVQL